MNRVSIGSRPQTTITNEILRYFNNCVNTKQDEWLLFIFIVKKDTLKNHITRNKVAQEILGE